MSKRTDNPDAGAKGTSPYSGGCPSGEERSTDVSGGTGERVRQDTVTRQRAPRNAASNPPLGLNPLVDRFQSSNDNFLDDIRGIGSAFLPDIDQPSPHPQERASLRNAPAGAQRVSRLPTGTNLMAPPGTYSSYPATRQYPSTAHPLVVARPPSQLAATTQTDAADQDASKSFTELLGNGGLLFDLPTGDPEATMQSGSFGFPLSDVTEGLLYHDPPNLFSRNNVALPSPPQQQQLTIGPASNMLQSEPPRGPRGRPDRSFEVHTTSSRLPLPAGHSPPPPADPHPPTTNISFITETGQSRTGRKRPRRKPEDIDRAYVCGFEGCPKSYGQLSHLNQHVSLFRHGPQRKKEEFMAEKMALDARNKARKVDRHGRPTTKDKEGDDEEEDDEET